MWSVGLIAEIKLRFRNRLVWTVGLIAEIKLCFRDGLVWTVGLIAEIRLRFPDGLAWTAGLIAGIKLTNFSSVAWTLPSFYRNIMQRKLQTKSLIASCWTVVFFWKGDKFLKKLRCCIGESIAR